MFYEQLIGELCNDYIILKRLYTISTTVNFPKILVPMVLTYVVLNFCKVSDYVVLIFEKNLTLHAMYFR